MKGFVPSLVWIPSKADPQTKIWVYVVSSGNKSEENSKRRRNETGKGEEPGKCVFKSKFLLFLKILFFFFLILNVFITDSMDVSLSELREMVMDREA